MSQPKRTWSITDHICTKCGGRILRCVTGNGMTPGGNPVHRCSLCGAGSTKMGGSDLCWCGYAHRGQVDTAYRCVPYSALEQHPQLLKYFRKCGCDPERGTGEVGIMLERDLYAGIKEKEEG